MTQLCLVARRPSRAGLPFALFSRVKLNNKPYLPEKASKLSCVKGKGNNAKNAVRGEDFIMTDDDASTLRKTYERDRDLQRRGVKIDDAIHGITDDDRKMLINRSLRKANSALSVS